MQQIGLPAEVVDAGGDFRRCQAQPREADVIVGPVEAGGIAVGGAFAVVELGAEDHVDDETVGCFDAPDLAAR